MTDHHYRISEPNVVSEIIDGEAIIMEMRSGNYYSAGGIGASIWQDLLDGRSHEQILTATQAFPQAPQARAEVEAFLAELETLGLIVQQPATGAAAVGAAAWSGPYAKPVLSSHDDMQDLIQLDPIHDVDDIGWPVRKVEG